MTIFDKYAKIFSVPDITVRRLLLWPKKSKFNVPKCVVFSHIAALFVSLYVSIVSPKKHHTAQKNKSFRCAAVFQEQIFVETRQKGE